MEEGRYYLEDLTGAWMDGMMAPVAGECSLAGPLAPSSPTDTARLPTRRCCCWLQGTSPWTCGRCRRICTGRLRRTPPSWWGARWAMAGPSRSCRWAGRPRSRGACPPSRVAGVVFLPSSFVRSSFFLLLHRSLQQHHRNNQPNSVETLRHLRSLELFGKGFTPQQHEDLAIMEKQVGPLFRRRHCFGRRARTRLTYHIIPHHTHSLTHSFFTHA